MRSYEASAEIAAPPSTVWEVLADVAGFPGWDSGVVSVTGDVGARPPAVGSRLAVTSAVAPDRAFPVTVAEVVPGRRMVWRGGAPFGLFTGTRTYALEPSGTGTRFTLREVFTGPLVPLVWRTMPDLGPSFERFAAGLRETAELRAQEGAR